MKRSTRIIAGLGLAASAWGMPIVAPGVIAAMPGSVLDLAPAFALSACGPANDGAIEVEDGHAYICGLNIDGRWVWTHIGIG